MPTLIDLPLILTLVCAGCWGQGPTASRIRSDTNDRYYPRRAIHFVEQGKRAKGVLIWATDGFDSPFRADWVTVLVPTPPSPLAGPVWKGDVGGEAAVEIARLPQYRDAQHVGMWADIFRERRGAPAVWVLGTDPLILGLPAGEPQRSWREFALTATGAGEEVKRMPPLSSLTARFVVDEELNQPLARVVVFPAEFWSLDAEGRGNDASLQLVTLAEPMPIDGVLAALGRGEGEGARLGSVEVVPLYDEAQERKDRGMK